MTTRPFDSAILADAAGADQFIVRRVVPEALQEKVRANLERAGTRGGEKLGEDRDGDDPHR